MPEIQSFVDAVPVQETAAPRNFGSNFQDAVSAIGGGLDTASRLLGSSAERRKAEAEAKKDAAVTQGALFTEDFKRREPLQEALEAGYLNQEQVARFGVDETESLAALDQAAAQGMGNSIKNALERSVRFQFAAMRNPGAAKEIASAYGIGNNSVEQDTLDALEKVEREQLQKDADQIRKRAEEEGYTEFLDKSNEEVIDMWIGSPAEQRERQIRQNQRSALAQESSIAERAPSAARAMALEMSAIPQQMAQVAAAYRQARGNANTGGDGSNISLSEHLTLWAEEKIADAARVYADFPKNLETYANGIRKSVADTLASKKLGMEQGTAEYEAQIKRPMDIQRMQMELEAQIFNASQNTVRALQNAIDLSTTIAREETRVAQLADEILREGPASVSPSLSRWLESPANRQRMALFRAGAAEGSTQMLHMLLDPEDATFIKNMDDAAMTLRSMIRTGDGVAGNEKAFAKVIGDMVLAYEYNLAQSPSKAKLMEQSILSLSDDPRFIEIVSSSIPARKLVKPYASAIQTDIAASLQADMDRAVTEIVNSVGNPDLPGSRETGVAAWRKMGQYMVLDRAATNKTGIPQYKLRDNIEEALSQEDIVAQQEGIDKYNTDLLRETDPNKYKLLQVLTGSSDKSSAIEFIIESTEGLAIGSLSPKIKVEDRDPKAVVDETELTREQALENLRGSTSGVLPSTLMGE